MSKTLVTGGAGFIGSHVARHLHDAGHEVTVLDDLSGGFLTNLPKGVDFLQGSVTDHDLVDGLFAEHGFDYVFHLAAYAAEGLSHFIRRFNYTNNVIGSINLLNASVATGTVKCFVFTSSIAVYGAAEPPMTEQTVPVPEDPYGVAKLAVEQDLRVAHEMFGLPYVIFRPHNVYGEGQNIGDRYRNVIGIFMNQILRGEPLTIFGDGEQTRAFTYIDAVAKPIAACIDMPETYGQVINIGGDRPFSVNRLVEEVSRAMGSKVEVRHLDPRNEVVHAYSDHTRAKALFGSLCDDVPLADGLARMAAWAKFMGPQEQTVFRGVEVRKNMPPSWQAVTP